MGISVGDLVEAKKYIQGQEYWVKCRVVEVAAKVKRYKVDFGPRAKVWRSSKEVRTIDG